MNAGSKTINQIMLDKLKIQNIIVHRCGLLITVFVVKTLWVKNASSFMQSLSIQSANACAESLSNGLFLSFLNWLYNEPRVSLYNQPQIKALIAKV